MYNLIYFSFSLKSIIHSLYTKKNKKKYTLVFQHAYNLSNNLSKPLIKFSFILRHGKSVSVTQMNNEDLMFIKTLN